MYRFGQSYDNVQWVSIAYLQAGKQDEAKKYYDIGRVSVVDNTYCKGGCKNDFVYLVSKG